MPTAAARVAHEALPCWRSGSAAPVVGSVATVTPPDVVPDPPPDPDPPPPLEEPPEPPELPPLPPLPLPPPDPSDGAGVSTTQEPAAQTRPGQQPLPQGSVSKLQRTLTAH